MREINPNIYPPDGYTFRESDGSIRRSDSWKHLEAEVRDYRLRNGLPEGNVWEDIMDQTCAKFPGFCRNAEPFVQIPTNQSMSFNQRVLEWFAACLRSKRLNAWRLVDDPEAARRAAICQRCPRQRALSTACAACIATVDASRTVLMDGRASRHQNLQCCDALGEDCSVSVYATQKPTDKPTCPAECWRK